MDILFLDIETAPMLGRIWSLREEVSSMKFILKDWFMLSWAAKWLGQKSIMSDALPNHLLYQKDKENDMEIVKTVHNVMMEADVIVTQNGIRFDLPKLNAKFLEHGLKPPRPYKKVDTCLVARKIFGFSSNKLDDIANLLKVGRKIETGGFELWEGCIRGDMNCWAKMVKYNKNDVVLLEKVYKKMLPFMSGHPNYNVYNETEDKCPKCGSKRLQSRGFDLRLGGKVRRYQCQECGGWCQGNKFIKNAV